MRLFARSVFCLFFLLLTLSDVHVVYADLTNEFFATSNGNCSNWENIANSLGSVDSTYATVSNKIPVCNWNFVTPFNIPTGSEINSIKVKVYNSSSGNIGGSSMSPAYNGVQSCIPPPFFPALIFNNMHEYVVTPANCPVTFPTLAQLNSSLMSWHFYNSGSITAAIDAISMQVAYTPTTPTPTLTPIPTLTPTPTPTKTPLILIPGIGGSELKVVDDTYWLEREDGHGGKFNYIYSKDETIWLNEGRAKALGEDDYFDVLRMQNDGVASEANIEINGNLLALAYQGTIDFFISNGYILNKDLFVFPYDWRKDISLTASLLDQKIQSIKEQTGSTRIDIVAHSMGGLVARNYIADAGRAQNVGKLFTLGTPHLGSADFLKNLRYGGCLTKPGILTELANRNICFGLVPSEIKDVIQNMISGFELAPSQSYFNFYSGEDNAHPYPFADVRDIDGNGITGKLNYSQIKTLLTNLGHNTGLFDPSEAFHSLDNDLVNTNGVEVINIVGSGLPTLGQIIERYSINFLGVKIPKKDEVNINGDKTVPLFSASLIDSGKNISLLGNTKVFYTRQEHGNLVVFGSALNLVKNILANNSQLPTGISTQVYSFSGTRVSVYSPVNIHVYDSLGNHTGPIAGGDLEANIPGSSYDTLDDAKFIWLPDDGQYEIKFEATDQGSFDFKIRKYENDTISQETLYKDIPLTISTKAEAQFDTFSSQSPIIHLDEDGNGTVDQDFSPSANLTGNAVFDQTLPQTEIQLSGVLGDNGWYKSDVIVTLNPQDEGSGSGILKTEYSLDNGQTINDYTEPFTISTEKINTLKFRSIDNAGNEEDPKETEIKIDKTSPEAKIFVDQDIQDLVIEGIDQSFSSVEELDNLLTNEKDDAIYVVKDLAGNTLMLDVRDRDKDEKDSFRIYSLQYNEETLIIQPDNRYNVSYKGKKDKLNVVEQNFEIKGEVKIRIKYDVKKNESTINVRESKEEKVKEVKDGLVLLQLLTNKGHLETSY